VDGIELLPDDIRDQVREACNAACRHIHWSGTKITRKIGQLAVEHGTIEQFDELQFTGQMAVAESVMRNSWAHQKYRWTSLSRVICRNRARPNVASRAQNVTA